MKTNEVRRKCEAIKQLKKDAVKLMVDDFKSLGGGKDTLIVFDNDCCCVSAVSVSKGIPMFIFSNTTREEITENADFDFLYCVWEELQKKLSIQN